MKVKWLVESFERDMAIDYLVNEIRLQGMECSVVEYIPFESGSYNQYNNNDCVVFHGSLNLARQIQREKGWIPGVICNFDNFKCSTYYSYWGKYLLNDDYIMLPMMEFYRRRHSIYNWYGCDNTVFIRPDSGSKTFGGMTLYKEDIDREFDLIKSYAGKQVEDILVVVSTPKVISKEWRIVIADKKVVASSQYKENGKLYIKEGCDAGAINLALLIAEEEWAPDIAYTLDICKSNDDYYLIEANSFSCSGLYDCHLPSVVRSISNVALKEWEDYQEI